MALTEEQKVRMRTIATKTLRNYVKSPAAVAEQERRPSRGAVSDAAHTINDLYNGFTQLPGVKQFGQLVGGAIGAAGAVASEAMQPFGTALAAPIVLGIRLAKGDNIGQAVARTGDELQRAGRYSTQQTSQFGQQIGEAGAPAAIVGQFGGIAPNAVLAFGQGVDGYETMREGISSGDTTKTIQGGIGFGTSVLGAYGAYRGYRGGDGLIVSNELKQRMGLGSGLTSAINKRALPETVKTSVTRLGEQTINSTDSIDLTPDELQAIDTVKAPRKSSVIDDIRALFTTAREAKNDQRNPTPYAKIGDEVIQGVEEVQQIITELSEQKKSVLQEAETSGVRFTGASTLLSEFEATAKERLGVIFDANGNPRTASGRGGTIDAQDAALLKDLYNDLKSLRGDKGASYVPQRVARQEVSGVVKPVTIVGEQPKGSGYAPRPAAKTTTILPDGKKIDGEMTSYTERPYSYNSNAVSKDTDGVGIRIADDVVDRYQSRLDYSKPGAVAVNAPVEGVVKQFIGQLNSMVKDQIGGSYRKLNSQLSGLYKLLSWLNKNLGPDAVRSGSLIKRIFSPTDGGTLRYLELLEQVTGRNIIDKAVIARQAMEAVGDSRGTSLLENTAPAPVAGAVQAIPVLGRIVDFLNSVVRPLVMNDATQEKALIEIAQSVKTVADGGIIDLFKLEKSIELIKSSPDARFTIEQAFGTAIENLPELLTGAMLGVRGVLEERKD